MRQFFVVILFSLLTIGFFAGFSNFGIPQIEPAPPPQEEKLDLGSMTMEQFVALGERIFSGRGTCTLCHNNLGRAPMLDVATTVAAERLADERYQGEATNAGEYIIESMIKPSAFVVAGFGKKGTNDAESPMPDVSKGSIGLSEAEIKAVVAYLQETGGAEITVEIPTDMETAEEEDEEEAEQRAAIADPQALMEQFACEACHIISGEGGDIGPDLSKIGAARDRDYLRRALIDPNAEVAEGFEPDTMPPEMGEQMYAVEVETLVDYLSGLK